MAIMKLLHWLVYDLHISAAGAEALFRFALQFVRQWPGDDGDARQLRALLKILGRQFGAKVREIVPEKVAEIVVADTGPI